LRKKYISLYAKLLRSDAERVVVDDNKQIKELDRELDAELIIQWRMLAHKFVAQSMESDLDLRKQKTKSSWWPFGWSSNSNKDENEPGNLTEDDWKRLNDIIGYKDGDNEQFLAIHERGDVPHTSLEIHMKHSASKLSDSNKYLADLSCDNLDCYVKFYLEAKEFDVRLGSYRLLSPNGLLAAVSAIFLFLSAPAIGGFPSYFSFLFLV
jgi:vacuolar protein sorting-associated protein 13A/C